MADRQRGAQLLKILQDVASTSRSTIQAESPGIFDRAAILARLTQGPFRFFIENPSARALAKIGGARKVAAIAYFAAQKNWMVNGANEELAGADPQLAQKIEDAFFALNQVVQDGLAAENRWTKLPENIVDQAVAEFFKGLLETLEAWLNFLAKPFGIPWNGILLGLGVLVAVVLWRKAT